MDTCQYANSCPPPPQAPQSFHALPFTGADLSFLIFLATMIVVAGVIAAIEARRGR